MSDNPVKKISQFGQSVWLDYIRRQLITSGKLKEMIERDGIKGMTSNPSIFEKAIVESDDYNADIKAMADDGRDAVFVYEALSRRDVQMAADKFKGVYGDTNALDGYVSLEVNPHLARDTDGTIAEARRLWAALDRPNVFIKVPATVEGLPAITELISEGININVTLLFGLPRYREVADAYLSGLEQRLAKGKPIDRVTSVASFFLSRIDSAVDPLLAKMIEQSSENSDIAEKIYGRTAISSAKIAYQIYKQIYSGPRFKKLEQKYARPQRLLWASTSTKNPGFKDTKYIEPLIGYETVNTIPLETLNAYRDHGNPSMVLEKDCDKADWVMSHLTAAGIDIDRISERLEAEGIEKFNEPFDKLMAALNASLLKNYDKIYRE